jgi:hypothetical protein
MSISVSRLTFDRSKRENVARAGAGLAGIRPPVPQAEAEQRRWAVWARGQIEGAFAAEGLRLARVRGVQGPHTFAFAWRLMPMTVKTIEMVEKARMVKLIEGWERARPVRVAVEADEVWVEVPSPWPQIVPGAQYLGKGMNVPMGISTRGKWLAVNLADSGSAHLVAVGATGGGKSVLMRNIAWHLAAQNAPNEVRIVVVGGKPEDWQPFAGLPHMWGILTDEDQGARALQWLYEEMRRRIASGRTPAFHVVTLIDDTANLLLAQPQAADWMAGIAQQGRSAHIHEVFGTQRLGERGVGGAMVSGNAMVRMVFPCTSATDAALFTGRPKSGAEQIGKFKGDTICVRQDGMHRIAGALVTDEDVEQLMRNPSTPVITLHPWDAGGKRRLTAGHVNLAPSPSPDKGGEQEASAGTGEAGGVIALGPAAVAAVPGENQTGEEQAVESDELPYREPTAEERKKLREMMRRKGSGNAVLRAAWGREREDGTRTSGKNKETLGWLHMALAEAGDEKTG